MIVIGFMTINFALGNALREIAPGYSTKANALGHAKTLSQVEVLTKNANMIVKLLARLTIESRLLKKFFLSTNLVKDKTVKTMDSLTKSKNSEAMSMKCMTGWKLPWQRSNNSKMLLKSSKIVKETKQVDLLLVSKTLEMTSNKMVFISEANGGSDNRMKTFMPSTLNLLHTIYSKKVSTLLLANKKLLLKTKH